MSKKIGIITIGQSPRTDVVPEMTAFFGEGVEVLERGEDWALVLADEEQLEDLARLRDALGVQPPAGVPAALLDAAADPLGDIVARYARTHAPFAASRAAADLGLAEAVITEVLHRLEELAGDEMPQFIVRREEVFDFLVAVMSDMLGRPGTRDE